MIIARILVALINIGMNLIAEKCLIFIRFDYYYCRALLTRAMSQRQFSGSVFWNGLWFGWGVVT